ncbi:MAG: hypothetical protein NVS2B7_25150 [Herpetosiphon sp.]
MHTRLLSYLLLLTVIVAGGGGFPKFVHAEGTGDKDEWSVAPAAGADRATTDKGYFVYQMLPGSQASGKVAVRNRGAQPVTIEFAAVDAETAQTGGSSFAGVETAAVGVARWIKLDADRLTLAPGSDQQIGFSVHAPADVHPGQFLAGIAAYVVKAPPAADQPAPPPGFSASIEIHRRYVIGVQADVPGAWKQSLSIPRVEVTDQPAGMFLGIQMRNDGSVFLSPSGSITVTNTAGGQVLAQPFKMGTFVPGTDVTYPVQWAGKPVAGTYSVAVDVVYGREQHATYRDTFVVSPQVVANAAEHDALSLALHPAVKNVAAAPSALQPWMIYGIGGLLLLVVILLALNLRRSGAKPRIG